jgi:hypothetical protein
MAALVQEGREAARGAPGIEGTQPARALIREAFASLVPAGFDVLEGERRGNFRRSPDVVVEAIDGDALAAHPDAGVQRMTVEQPKGPGARNPHRDGVSTRHAS